MKYGNRYARKFHLACTLLIWLTNHAQGYSGGAPQSACSTMNPVGHSTSPQTMPSPYKITTSSAQFLPGQTLTVTVAGSPALKGLMVSAYSHGFAVGTMVVKDSALTKLVCGDLAITQVLPIQKTEISFDWTAPSDLLKDTIVTFKATLVQERAIFWMNVQHNITAQSGPAGFPAVSGGNDIGKSISTTAPGYLPLDPECSVTKSCFHDCKQGHCSFIVSWKDMGEDLAMDIRFRLQDAHDRWFALGFSRDQRMGDDSITECNMQTGNVEVLQSYNKGYENDYLDNKKAALSQVKASAVDGVLSCSFLRRKSYPRDPKVFDLNEDFYIFSASGESLPGNKMPHVHEVPPIVSDQQIDLQIIGSVTGKTAPISILVQIHGGLMIIAWLLFTSVGVMTAKYGKPMWPKLSPCGINIWFHIHRMCMLLTVALTIAAFVIIFIEIDGFSKFPPVVGKAYRPLHPPLGILAVIFTLINPIMACFRPDAKAPNRYVFNWSHWGVGVLAWIVAIITIFIGLDLEKAHAPWEAIIVMLVWGGYHILILAAMEIIPRCLARCYSAVSSKTVRKGRVYDLERVRQVNGAYTEDGIGVAQEMKPMENKNTDNKETEKKAEKEKTDFSQEELKIRRFILVFHYGVVVVLTLIMLLILYLYTPTPADEV